MRQPALTLLAFLFVHVNFNVPLLTSSLKCVAVMLSKTNLSFGFQNAYESTHVFMWFVVGPNRSFNGKYWWVLAIVGGLRYSKHTFSNVLLTIVSIFLL